MDLKTKSFTELKRMYPDISARSKKSILEKIDALEVLKPVADKLDVNQIDLIDVIQVVEKEDRTKFNEESGILTWYNIEKWLFANCKSNKKILIKTPTSIEADLMWSRINSEIFPKFNQQEIRVMASSTRRDMHLNGTCYIRFVCHTNFDHIKRLIAYTDYKELV